VVGAGADRLWNTVSLIMPFGGNMRWVTKLDKRGFQISTGTACASGKSGPSSVLAALGFDDETAQRGVRVSAGWETTELDWRALLGAFIAVAVEVRE
jgi:cysteine desulfurase